MTARLALLAVPLAVLLALSSLISPAGAEAATKKSSRAVSSCSAFAGAKSLGTAYSDSRVVIATCGTRPSFDGSRSGGGAAVLPYAGSRYYYSGYQCIELIARYLKLRYAADAVLANGSQAVDRYASAYPTKFRVIANGTRSSAPRAGDVLSLSGNRSFNDVGHTGIVTSSSVNSSGNGTIRAAEQNFGGSTGARGYHVYQVKSWRVVFTGLPHIKWLRAR